MLLRDAYRFCGVFTSASMNFVAAARASLVCEHVSIAVPLMVAVPFDVGEVDVPDGAGVGVELLH